MKRDLRKKAILKRKNFFATLVISVFLWVLLGFLVYFVEPDVFGAVVAFFVLIFFCFLFTLSLLFAHTRRGFLVSLGLTLFLVLRYLGVGNVVNFLLIFGVIASFEIYLLKN